MQRRDMLKFSAGAAGAVTLAPMSFAQAADGNDTPGTQSRTITGELPTGAPDFVYVPVEVPRGTREISVSYSYDKPEVPDGVPGNALDIGVFDERGTDQPGEGFRGWSGGFREEFTISAERATPGYLAGPVGAGTWYVALGPYTVAPQGMTYELTVTLTRGEPGRTPKPVFPPERAKGRGRAWYRGDCHLHTVHSDGERTPAEVATAAREAGLDFIVSTEHNTTSGHAAWDGLFGDDLLILCGEEITTRNGHYLALGTDPGTFVDWRYRARDDAYDRYVRRIHRAGGLVVPAHPNCPFVGCQWKFGYAGADAVELWNGPWTPDDELALAAWDNMLVERRDWLPALGCSDAHREGQDVGLPQTVVYADDLTRRDVLAAISAGRSYLTESSKITLDLTATDERGRHAAIGGRLRTKSSAKVTVRFTAQGAPKDAVARLLTDQGELVSGPAADGLEWQTTASLAAYVRGEVRHPGGSEELPGAMAAMTNPVWLEAGS